MRKLIVTGARALTDPSTLREVLDRYDPELVIHGGASGADQYAESWAKAKERDSRIYRARWSAHRKLAGFARNERMLKDNPDSMVVAFLKGPSNGTRDCICRAVSRSREVIVYEGNSEVARYSEGELLLGKEVR